MIMFGLIRPSARSWDIQYHGFPWNLQTIRGGGFRDWLRSLYWAVKLFSSMDIRPVPIHDAMHLGNNSFHTAGFTRIKLPGFHNFSADMVPSYKAALEKELSKLFPAKDVATTQYYYPILSRGRVNAANVPVFYAHADFFPSLSAMQRTERLAPFFVNETGMNSTVVLGIWKPVNMANTVCKGNLAFLDSSTIESSDLVAVEKNFQTKTIDQGVKRATGAISLVTNEVTRHRWYSYNNLSTDDLLIWVNYHPDMLPVIHSAFNPHDCPHDELRSSIETRVVLRLDR